MILLHQIQSLKSLGFTLDDIKNRIEVLDTPQKVEHALHQQEVMIEEKIKQLQNTLSAIKALDVYKRQI